MEENKNFYYASKKNRSRNLSNSLNARKTYITTYYFSLGEAQVSHEVKTNGTLSFINSISEAKYEKWRKSMNIEDFYKQKDYEQLMHELTLFGKFVRESPSNFTKELVVENCTLNLEKRGFRRLKDFEERILLRALKGK